MRPLQTTFDENENSLIEAIRGKVKDLCGQSVAVDQALWSSHLLKSLGRAELAFFIAELAELEIEPTDVCQENFESIQHMIRFIKEKTKACA